MRWNAVAMSLGAAFQNSKGDEAGVFSFAPLIAIVEIAVTVGLFFWGR
jgi:hypothetical protein